jgi:hypothetical protein
MNGRVAKDEKRGGNEKRKYDGRKMDGWLTHVDPLTCSREVVVMGCVRHNLR